MSLLDYSTILCTLSTVVLSQRLLKTLDDKSLHPYDVLCLPLSVDSSLLSSIRLSSTLNPPIQGVSSPVFTPRLDETSSNQIHHEPRWASGKSTSFWGPTLSVTLAIIEDSPADTLAVAWLVATISDYGNFKTNSRLQVPSPHRDRRSNDCSLFW